MDRQKIRELLQQTHPSHKLAEPDDDSRYTADSNAADVDVSDLTPKTWKKFRTASSETPAGSDPAGGDLRERFRPRKLTGAGSGPGTPPDEDAPPPPPPRRTPGKLTLERLVPADAASDSDDSVDVLVDEDDGVIGESDSGPKE